MSGVLKAARAAAFLTLATGINGTVAALYPRYEPIYVYLLAIVVVSWMSGLFLGVTAAVAAVILYDWMFSPVRIVPSAASIVPFVVAVAAAVTTRAVRSPILQRREIAPTPPPPLLPPIPRARPMTPAPPAPPVVSVMPRVDTEQKERLEGQIAQLERQIAELTRQVGVAHAQTENEIRLRADAAEAARSRYTALQHELDSARIEAVESARRSAALHAELNVTSAGARESDQKAAKFAQELAATAARIGELEERLSNALQELDTAWRRVDEEKGRAEREVDLRAKVDQIAAEKLQKAAADIAARYQSPLAEAKARLADAFTRVPVLERERDGLLSELIATRAGADRDKRHAESLKARVDELEQAFAETVEEERAKREGMSRDFDGRLQSIVTGLTNDHEDAISQSLVEREAARAEVRSFTKKVEALQAKLTQSVSQQAELVQATTELRAAAERERRRADEEVAKHAVMAKEFDVKLQNIVTGVTNDLEETLGNALVEKEAARAEARILVKKLEALQLQVSEVNDARTKLEEMFAVERRCAAEQNDKYENAVSSALLGREGARAEARALTDRIETLERQLAEVPAPQDLQGAVEAERSRADEEVAKRQAMAKEFDARLQSIVSGLTNDYEQPLADAMVEREAARAEARTAAGKVDSMQRKLAEFDTTIRAHVEKATAELRSALETERRRAAEERAARVSLDAEWGEKLQRIVNHLASDHETDLGEAMLEKEAAKAEVRNLSGRISALQQKLDREREMFRTTMERPIPPGIIPPDPQGALRRILIVHSDAGVRELSKHALEQAGYSVMTAADGLEGLRMTATFQPAAVIAEAVMPKMNGREMVQLLKSKQETANVKIILVSSQAGELERGTDFRADGVLTNPGDLEALRATLESVLTG